MSYCSIHARERHLILLNYSENQVISLEDRLIAIGRDPSQDIAIPSDVISRHHATLLRVPHVNAKRCDYRIFDGGPRNNSSKNGVFVNGERKRLHLLEHGDLISLGGVVKGIYLKADLTDEEFVKYKDIIKTAKDIDEKTRDKIALVTRVFCKLTSYLSPNEPTSLMR